MKTIIVLYNQCIEKFSYYHVESEFTKLVEDGEVLSPHGVDPDPVLDPFLTTLFQHLPLTKNQFLQAAREGCDITHIVYV